MKKRLNLLIAGGIIIIALILGSFFDLQLTKAVFDQRNTFGIIVSSFGMIPGYGTLSFMGGALFYFTLKRADFQKWLKALLIIFSIAMYGVSVYFLGKDVFSVNGFDNKELYWLGFVIMGVLMCPMAYLGYRIARYNENPRMWIVILVVSAVIFIALVPGVTLFKSIMHRPRFRYAINLGFVDFHNWWEPCKNSKELIDISGGVLTKEEFKSFPSGHAGASMVGIILLSYLPLFNKKWMKYQTLFFFLGFGWALVVMFARVIVGAHFLSDVSFGALLTLVCFFIGNEAVVRKLLPEEKETQLENCNE